MIKIGNDWDDILKDEYAKSYFARLMRQIEMNYNSFPICPPREKLFRAMELTPYRDVRVVILGQDPYHIEGLADGLAFSVEPSAPIPSTLANIFTELHDDLGVQIPQSGSLEKWAKQGVLLLNCIFTVREGVAGSHRNYGWEEYTKRILTEIDKKEEPVVYILWGNFARFKTALLHNPKHKIITSFHPSPLSAGRGFFGSKPFSKANDFLVEQGAAPIDWSL